MKNEAYNGWTNWDTWNANLRITNDEVTYSMVKGRESEYIRDHWKLFWRGVDGIDTDRVNFEEIAEGLKE